MTAVPEAGDAFRHAAAMVMQISLRAVRPMRRAHERPRRDRQAAKRRELCEFVHSTALRRSNLVAREKCPQSNQRHRCMRLVAGTAAHR